MKKISNLDSEARVFSKRIKKRSNKGFVPDLKNLNVCNYFYKSFWRHPDFANLYVGEMSKYYVNFFKKRLKKKGKILDLGCGPGYFTLELARAGFDVVGVDISQGAISSAKQTMLNLKRGKKLKLKYICSDLKNLNFDNQFDGVLCSGFLHHIKNVNKISKQIRKSMKKKGSLLIYEPQHKEWKNFDALLVMSLRLIFKELDMWHDKSIKNPKNLNSFKDQLKQVHSEFYFERDKNEKNGQSPNDLSSDKKEILRALKKDFKLIKLEPAFSFIYRFLGGLRGNQTKLKSLSKLIANLEKFGIATGMLNANYFYASFEKK